MGNKQESYLIMRDLVGFEEYYSVTIDGNIYSKRSKKFLKKNLKKNGYEYIELNVNGKNTWHRVHRLVAITWIPNPNNKSYINHKNGIKNDNRVINLEWVTGSENNIHAINNKLFYPKQITFRIIDQDNNIIIEEIGLRSFLQKIDFKQSSIYNYRNKGYIPQGQFKSMKIEIIK